MQYERCVVRGAALSGGEGSIFGTILGVLIIGVLRNGLVLLNISPFWQTTIIGLVIILAVGIDKWTRGRRTRSSLCCVLSAIGQNLKKRNSGHEVPSR